MIFLSLTGSGCKVKQVDEKNLAVFPEFDMEGHRGARGLMPENTIPAMYQAIDLGVSTLEMDVHVTKDKQVILAHDHHLNHLFTLSPRGEDITEEDAKNLVLYHMDYDQVRTFDVGTKYYDRFPDQKKLKVHIPLLAELIDSVQKYLQASGKTQVFYNIETKSMPAGDNVLHPEPEEFIDLIMDVVAKKNVSAWVIIQSFDIRTLKVLHQKYPHVRTSFLVEDGSFEGNIQKLGFVPTIYSPEAKLVTADLVKQVHAKGVKLIPWTVNDKQEIKHLKWLGVDGIISDYPNLFRDSR